MSYIFCLDIFINVTRISPFFGVISLQRVRNGVWELGWTVFSTCSGHFRSPSYVTPGKWKSVICEMFGSRMNSVAVKKCMWSLNSITKIHVNSITKQLKRTVFKIRVNSIFNNYALKCAIFTVVKDFMQKICSNISKSILDMLKVLVFKNS